MRGKGRLKHRPFVEIAISGGMKRKQKSKTVIGAKVTRDVRERGTPTILNTITMMIMIINGIIRHKSHNLVRQM